MTLENVSEFFKDIKDRLSSPLFSSFVISWLIINWRIVIGLIFYKNADLQRDNYKSFIDLIYQNTNIFNNLLLPLLAAVIYVLVFPLIKVGIQAYGAMVKKRGNKWVFGITAESVIRASEYIKLKRAHDNAMSNFADLKNEEEAFSTRAAELTTANNFLNDENRRLDKKITSLEHNNKQGMIGGSWSLKVISYTSESPIFNGNNIRFNNNTGILSNNGNDIAQYRVLWTLANLTHISIALKSETTGYLDESWAFEIQNDFNTLTGANLLGARLLLQRNIG